MRLAAYGAISTSLATAVILAAFQQRPNFYSACVYLSQSNACLMVLTNMGVFLTILLGFTVQRIFFGHLRAIEEAHLRERTWFAVTETFLAMTVFRDEFNTRFVVMFVSLLFVKCFHWICQDRIDYMEQFPTIPWTFHLRTISAMLVFLGADVAFISHAIDVTIRHGASMMIMFGFEFILLAATMTAIIVKYVLNVIDSRHTEAWENRSVYMFYLELATDLFKLLTYLAFFSIILTYYGLPLHIIRDVYITLRSFGKKLMSFIRYRQATAHMNERYPDATAEELEATGDRTCIICREQMVHGGEPGRERTRPKKLRCGHILHFHCLRSWLERQQNCPTCRRPVLEETPPRQAPVNRPPAPAPLPLPIPPPPVPPAAMPAQPGAAPTPTTPGPTPTPIQPTLPRIAAGAPINLPPGYTLPPGWAVIPAHNVQIIPPATQPLVGTGSPTVQVVVQGMPPGLVAQPQGPPPGSATSPGGGSGDVTNNTINDQVPPTTSGQTATAPPPRSPTNSNTPTSTTPTNPQNLNLPNLMQQRTAGHRMLATQSPHPAFPIAIPLVPATGNAGGIQYRPTTRTAESHARVVVETQSQPPPRVNGTTNPPTENRDADERFAILSQMSDSVRTMQDLLARMQSFNQPLPPTATATRSVSPQPATSPVNLPSPSSTSNALQSRPSNGHNREASTPLRSPPAHHRMHKRRSMSPVGPHEENEPHPADRLHRLSSSDEELSPEELADIKAPWVEEQLDDELPLQEVRTSRQNSPPSVRSSSQSPSRQLRRRGSLLRHEITEQMLDDERGREKERTLTSLDLEPTAVDFEEGASADKGKGKPVSMEDAEENA